MKEYKEIKLGETKSSNNKIAQEVPIQEQSKNKIKKAIKILGLIAIMTSILNIMSLINYNKLIKREATFLKHAEDILFKIEKNYEAKKE